MSLSFFDVQTGVLGSVPGVKDSPGIADLKASMQQINAVGALVRIAPDTLESDYQILNNLLYEACENDETLIPCPVVLPNSGMELVSEKAQIDAVPDCRRPGRLYSSTDRLLAGGKMGK